MEKSCPGKDGHPSRSVNFSEVNYFARATTLTTALAHALIVSFRQSMLTRLGEPVFISRRVNTRHTFSPYQRVTGPENNLA